MSFRLKYWYFLTVLNILLSILHASQGSNYVFLALALLGLSGYMVITISDMENKKDEDNNE